MEMMGEVCTRLGLKGVPGVVPGFEGACLPCLEAGRARRADPPVVGALACWFGWESQEPADRVLFNIEVGL